MQTEPDTIINVSLLLFLRVLVNQARLNVSGIVDNTAKLKSRFFFLYYYTKSPTLSHSLLTHWAVDKKLTKIKEANRENGGKYFRKVVKKNYDC